MSQFTVEDCVDFLRYMEVAVLGLMAFTFLTDNGPGRGRLAHDLHMLWGYPTWIVPVAGSVQVRAPSGLQSCAPRTRGERSAVLTQAAWQALICWANFAGAGRRYVAQKLLAFLMGGSAAPAHRRQVSQSSDGFCRHADGWPLAASHGRCGPVLPASHQPTAASMR